MSTTQIPRSTGVPPFRRGEIKNVKSYRQALRQLAARGDVPGNTALALYDDAGNVRLQVFGTGTGGVRRIIFDRGIGRVPVPGASPPGAAPFGNRIEPSILRLLGRVTGQRFRPKAPNAPGPDIEAMEMMGEALELPGEVLGELEVRDAFTATVAWAGPHTLQAAKGVRHPGVYVLEKDNQPVYVGKTTRQTIGRRWGGRLRTFDEFGLGYPAGFQVWTGAVTPSGPVSRVDAIDSVEVVLIRQLLGGKEAKALFGGQAYNLTNKKWGTRRFIIPKGKQVTITHTGGPAYIAGVPKIASTSIDTVKLGRRVEFEVPYELE
jgi:hypothetical protein